MQRSTHGPDFDHHTAHEDVLMEWRFPEYEKRERGKSWFITAFIITAALVVWAIATANFLFALIVVMVVIIIVTHHYSEPSEVVFQITKKGIFLDDHFYPYQSMDRFWILYNPPEVKKLYFHFKSILHPQLAVPLQDRNPLKVRSLLLKHLEEDVQKEEESASEILARRLKL